MRENRTSWHERGRSSRPILGQLVDLWGLCPPEGRKGTLREKGIRVYSCCLVLCNKATSTTLSYRHGTGSCVTDDPGFERKRRSGAAARPRINSEIKSQFGGARPSCSCAQDNRGGGEARRRRAGYCPQVSCSAGTAKGSTLEPIRNSKRRRKLVSKLQFRGTTLDPHLEPKVACPRRGSARLAEPFAVPRVHLHPPHSADIVAFVYDVDVSRLASTTGTKANNCFFV